MMQQQPIPPTMEAPRQVVQEVSEVRQQLPVQENVVHTGTQRVVERIVEVPEPQTVVKTVEQIQYVPKQVKKVVFQENIIEQPVEQVVTEVVEVPKIVIEEEVVEQPVEQVVTVPKHVKKVIEVPKVVIQENIIRREVEQVVTVPKHVPQQKTVQRVQNIIQEQPKRTIEVNTETVIEKVITRK